MGIERHFQCLALFRKTFLLEHMLCHSKEGGIGFFRITVNLVNKKLSVFPPSWSPITATQLEELEAERREILWFDPNSLHYSWCVHNASGFCAVQDTEYLCLPQQYSELYIELSTQILQGGTGRPIPWDILGVEFFEVAWVDYVKRSLNHREVTFTFYRAPRRPYIIKWCPVLVSSAKDKCQKINQSITAMQFEEVWDTDTGWECLKCWHHENQHENLLVTALGLYPYSSCRQRQYKHQRLNCPCANRAQLFKCRKWPTLFPPLYTQAGVSHSVAATRARLMQAHIWHWVAKAGRWQRHCHGARDWWQIWP